MEKEVFPFVPINDDKGLTSNLVLEWFSPNDVSMITSDKKGGGFHHIKGKIYKCLNLSLEEYEEVWFEYGFRWTERGNVVNLNKVKLFDVDDRILYFEEIPTKTSLKALVSLTYLDVLKKQRCEFNIRYSSSKVHQKLKSTEKIANTLFGI